MKNVTITLDEETANWARVYAAQNDMSVSRLVGEMLARRMQEVSEYDRAKRAWLFRFRADSSSSNDRGCVTVRVGRLGGIADVFETMSPQAISSFVEGDCLQCLHPCCRPRCRKNNLPGNSPPFLLKPATYTDELNRS